MVRVVLSARNSVPICPHKLLAPGLEWCCIRAGFRYIPSSPRYNPNSRLSISTHLGRLSYGVSVCFEPDHHSHLEHACRNVLTCEPNLGCSRFSKIRAVCDAVVAFRICVIAVMSMFHEHDNTARAWCCVISDNLNVEISYCGSDVFEYIRKSLHAIEFVLLLLVFISALCSIFKSQWRSSHWSFS